MYYMPSIISRASRTIETAFLKYGMINFTLTPAFLVVWRFLLAFFVPLACFVPYYIRFIPNIIRYKTRNIRYKKR